MNDKHAYDIWKAHLEGHHARQTALLELLQRQFADLKQPPTQPVRRGGCYAWAG